MSIERETVHISDDTGRIAMKEVRTQGTDPSPASLTRYIYSNHLQSASLELDENAAIISYEEYHPYGTTSYQANNTAINAVAKRYRYTGKERDEESGLYYYGARYYIPWLCRWAATDPINSENYNLLKGYGIEKNKKRSFLKLCASSYEYCYDNPVRFTDPTGEQVPAINDSDDFIYDGGVLSGVEIIGERTSHKSKYLGQFGIDLGSFGNGIADGLIGALPDLAGFIWDLLTSSEARQALMDGLKNLISDPLGTLGSMLEEKWNLYSAVLSGQGTAEQKYQVGVDIGNLAFDLLLAGGAAFLAKGAKTLGKLDIKPKKPKVDNKRIDYDNYGGEFIDDGFRTIDQPLTINPATTKDQLLLKAGKLHKHHVLPQQFRKWFAERGISNIDDYAVQISQSTHLKGVHGKGLGSQLPGNWNKQWADFIKANPNATPSEIFHQAEGMLKRYGLEHLPYIPYK